MGPDKFILWGHHIQFIRPRDMGFLEQGPTLIRYKSAAANINKDIGGGGVAGPPKNLNRRRLGLFSIGGGGVHISNYIYSGSSGIFPLPF